MQIITKTSDLAAACDGIAAQPFVAVDTEFLREDTYWPELCLVQMASPEEAFIIDPLVNGIDLTPLFELMADTGVVKVFHAGRQDIEIVWTRARLIPQPVFDTQVAAMVCGFGESVGYGNLVKRITNADVDKSSRFTDWSRRPLSDKQLRYALGDVTHLRDVYVHLREQIEASGREDWLAEEIASLTDPNTYQVAPDDAWRRMKLRVKSRKSLAVMMELAAWREAQAQAQNVPRARILRDEALYDIANRMPTDAKQLGQLRTLSEGFARSAKARDILATVKRGIGRDPKTIPSVNSGKALSSGAQALVELLRVQLKAAAANSGVAAKLIADAEELERIAAETEPDVPALRGWRRELFGEDALRLKRGEIALSVRDGAVVSVPVAKRSSHGTSRKNPSRLAS